METGVKGPVRGGYALPGLVTSAHIDVDKTIHDSAVEMANLIFLASENDNKPNWGVTKEGLLYEKTWWTLEYWSWSSSSLAEDVLQGRIKDTLDVALETHSKAIEVLQKKKIYKPEEQSRMEQIAKKVEEYYPKALARIRKLEAYYPKLVAAYVASSFSNSLRWTTIVKLSDVKQDVTPLDDTGSVSPGIVQSTLTPTALGPKPFGPPPPPPTGYKPKKIVANADKETGKANTLKGEANAEEKEKVRLQKESFVKISGELKRKAEARRALLDAVEEANKKLDKFIPANLKREEESAKISAEIAKVRERQKGRDASRSNSNNSSSTHPQILMQSKMVYLKPSQVAKPSAPKQNVNVQDSSSADEISSIFAQLKPGASVKPSMLRRVVKTEEKDTENGAEMMQSVMYDMTPNSDSVPAAAFEPKKKSLVNNMIVSEVLQRDENFLHRSQVMAMSIDSLSNSMEMDPK